MYGQRTRDASPYNASQLMHCVPKTLAVDFSYFGFTGAQEIVHHAPRSGVVFVRKQKEKEQSKAEGSAATPLGEVIRQKAEAANSMLFQFGDKKGSNGKTQVTDDGVVVIKAKDENYAFKETDQAVYNADKDMSNWVVDANGNLVRRKLTSHEEQLLLESKRTLYRCTSLKLNNNRISSLEKFERAMYLSLFKPQLTLHVLDLSCNQLVELPVEFLSAYPIHTVLLHGNFIASIEEVKRLLALTRTLRSLTLFDNPIQRAHGRRYRMLVLSALPCLTALDDVHVTTAERQKLETFVAVFAGKKDRAWMQKSLANAKLPPIHSGVTPSPSPMPR